MPPPEAIVYDPAEPQDLPAIWQAFRAATDPAALAGARHPDPHAPGFPPRIYPHLLATSEGSFHLARQRETPIGFVAAVPRGPVWFLAQIWVEPSRRGRGIGTRLYRLARRSTRGTGSRTRAAMAADDGGGLVLALRDGLLARYPIFHLQGDGEAAARLWEAQRPPASVRLVAYDREARLGQRSPLLALDREARGAPRPQDHAFWLADPERRGFLVWLGKRAVAYFYVGADGEIGPLAAAGPQGLVWALRFAAREAARVAPAIGFRVPAIAGGALGTLVGAGFRITSGQLLLASAPFGRAENYLPADDMLF